MKRNIWYLCAALSLSIFTLFNTHAIRVPARAHSLRAHVLGVYNKKLIPTKAGQFIWDQLTPGLPLLLDSNLDVVTQNVDLASQTSGGVSIALGGTNSTTPLQNNRLMYSHNGQIIEAPALLDGQIFIGATDASPVPANISGTASQINVTHAAGSITLSAPQNIDLISTPTFAGINFQSVGATTAVTLQAPSGVNASYTVTLPATAPTAGQVLQATSASGTAWNNVSDPLTLYVSVSGDDTTGNGSLVAPYASLKMALSVANARATEYTPVTIAVGSGIFVEDTSQGPLVINPTNGGFINIVGSSSETTVFTSYTTTQTLLYMPASGRLSDLAIAGITQAPAVCADGAGNNSAFINAVAIECQQGFVFKGGLTTNYYLAGVATESCGVGIVADNSRVLMYNSSFDGALETALLPANIGVLVTGPAARLVAESCAFLYCAVCAVVKDQSNATFIGGSYISSTSGVQATSQATCIVNGSTFYDNSGVNMLAQDLGTTLQSTACNIDGISLNNLAQGTGLLVTTSAQANIAVASLTNLLNGIVVGTQGDDSTTQVLAVGVTITACAGAPIIQQADAQMTFVDGALNRTLVSIANPAYTSFNTTDVASGNATIIGQHSDANQDLILVDVGTPQLPGLTYQSDDSGNKGIIYHNPNSAQTTLLGVCGQNSAARLIALTGSADQSAMLTLASQSANADSSTTVRGWDLVKTGTQALLAGHFYNTDLSSSQPTIDRYTAFQFDGFNNVLQFPAVSTSNMPTYSVTQLQWAGDTNLYRAQEGVLQTDTNFAIQGLSGGNSALYADGNKQLAASITSSYDLAQLAGITGGNVQTQLNNKLSTAGGALTGALALTQGTLAAPALTFTPLSQTGFAVIGNVLTFINSGTACMTIDQNGAVALNQSSSSNTLNVTGNTTLAGNLVVTQTLTTQYLTLGHSPVASTDAATKAYVDSVAQGLQVVAPCVALADANMTILFGTVVIDGVSLVAGNRVLLINQINGTQNGIWVVQDGGWTRPADFQTAASAQAVYTFIQSGSVYGNTAYFCTSLYPNAFIGIDPLTFVQFSNVHDIQVQNVGSGIGICGQPYGQTVPLKTLSAGPNIALTAQDTDIVCALTPSLSISHNVTAAGVMQAATVSDGTAVLQGGTLSALNLIATGTITAAAGSAAMPSINFVASPSTGLSTPLPDTLVLSTAGVATLQLNSAGTITIPAFTSAGIVHNDTTGRLYTSLITGADISATAAIADTQLALIQTAGKVANSATTATAANSPYTLVMRDNMGNFSAGTLNAALQAPAGSVALPAITFANSPNTGLSSPVAGQLSLSAGGTELVQLQAGGGIYLPGFVSNNGLVKSTSGMLSAAYLTDADIAIGAAIQDSKLATIQTPNKIANSATTATSAQSVNTIVARDGAGNFTAQSATYAATSNQLTLGGAVNVTLNAPTPAASRVYTVPDTGTATSTFIMADGPQTLHDLLTCDQLSVPSGALTVGTQTGVITGNNGLYSASVGTQGQRLATFDTTPTVGWYRSLEPSRESLLFDDFIASLGDTQWFIGGSTSASSLIAAPAASAPGKEIGVIQLSTGGAPDGSAVITKQLNGTVLGNGSCYVEWRVALATLSTTNQQFTFRCGLGDSSVGTDVPAQNPITGIWFEQSGTSANPVWIINTASGGNTTSYPTTQAIAQGVYYRLGFLVDAAADSVSFYINDSLVGVSSGANPIVSTLPTSAQPVGLFAHIIKNSGTTARTVTIDYALCQYLYTAQR